ncbi:MAG TPA: hypothetical protein VHK46_07430 [Gaiellaceae bacterium]|nr:hypothetical protein [Gaiellaceae bacterium]HEX2496652.1 hypothetical protein [Gaiellaceae bacterium]
MSDVRAAETDEGPPAPVYIALVASYALAVSLLLFGFLGFLTWAAVGDRVGVGATILGLVILGATYLAWQGSKAGRAIIGLLSAVAAVAAVVYIFTGPRSAILPSLFVAGLGASVVVLLFFPESSKRYYGD